MMSRRIDGELYRVTLFEAESRATLAYDQVVIDADIPADIEVPGLIASFQIGGVRYPFPLAASLLTTPQEGTLFVRPAATLPVGIHVFPFQYVRRCLNGHGLIGLGTGGYGAPGVQTTGGALPVVRYFLTSYAADPVAQATYYVKGLIT